LIFGILFVDARGRKLSFNDTDPPFEMVYHADETAELQINAFSLDRRVNVCRAGRVTRAGPLREKFDLLAERAGRFNADFSLLHIYSKQISYIFCQIYYSISAAFCL
jgi:hypothetical protein